MPFTIPTRTRPVRCMRVTEDFWTASTISTRSFSASPRARRPAWTHSNVFCWKSAGRALENAGQAPDRLAGSSTGTFLGIGNSDYFRMAFASPERIDTYSTSAAPSASRRAVCPIF